MERAREKEIWKTLERFNGEMKTVVWTVKLLGSLSYNGYMCMYVIVILTNRHDDAKAIFLQVS